MDVWNFFKRLFGARAPSEASGRRGKPRLNARGGMRVLVVDDSATVVALLARMLRQNGNDVPILVLTARDAIGDRVDGLDAGADDYMVKPFSFEVLLAHIRALLRRREAEQPAVLRYADLTLEPGRHAVTRGERPVTLTSLEFRLLHEFLRHPEQVLPKELLLDRVWGYDFGGNANVVEVYVKQLRQKLESAGEGRLLHTIRGVGYVLRETAP